MATQLNAANLTHNSSSSGEVTPTSPNTLAHFPAAAGVTPKISTPDINCNDSSTLTAAQLSTAYQMFMPNQFHLAAAAANAAQQQQQVNEQQLQQQSCTTNQVIKQEFNNNTVHQALTTHTNAAVNSPTTESSISNLNNNSQIPTNTSTSTTPSNNPNDLQGSTNTNNNTAESRISPNLNP